MYLKYTRQLQKGRNKITNGPKRAMCAPHNIKTRKPTSGLASKKAP